MPGTPVLHGDEHPVDLQEIDREVDMYFRMMRKNAHTRHRNTRTYRFARGVAAYKELVRGLNVKIDEIFRKYDELVQEHHHLAERSAQEITVVNNRLKQLEARFAPLKEPVIEVPVDHSVKRKDE